MTQTTKNINSVRKHHAKGIFSKAKSLFEKKSALNQFEGKIRGMGATANMTIFGDDCSRTISLIGKNGPGGWIAIEAKEHEGRIFVPFEPHNCENPNSIRAFFIKQDSVAKHSRAKYSYFMDNKLNFSEIMNIDAILMDVMDVMHEAYAKRIPISPFESFMLQFPKGTTKDNISTAKLAMHIPDREIHDLNGFLASSQNDFLDHFLVPNFMNVVIMNPELEKKVLDYHGRMVEDKKREFSR